MSKYGVMVMGPAGAGKVSSLHPKHTSLSVPGALSVPSLGLSHGATLRRRPLQAVD